MEVYLKTVAVGMEWYIEHVIYPSGMFKMTTAKPNLIHLLTTTVLAAVLMMSTNSLIKLSYTETKQNENNKKEQAATTQLYSHKL